MLELQVSPGVNNRSVRDVIRPDAVDEPGFTVCNVSLLDLSCLLAQKVGHGSQGPIRVGCGER